MPDGRLTWWKVVTLAVWTAVGVVSSPESVALAQDAAPPAAESPAEAAQRDLQQLQNTLTDPNASQAQRDEAAKRLQSRRSPEAREILRSTLIDVGNRGGQLAVARALVNDVPPDESFITPLYALMGSDQSLTEAGAQALAAHKNNPQVLTRLQDFARNRNNRTGRVAAIRALGTFVDKRAAQTLVDLLASNDESTTARDAAADALIDMTGLTTNGRDVKQWQGWWQANAAKPETQWKLDLLTERAARLEQAQARHEQLAEEMTRILREQYQAIPEAQRGDTLMRYLKSSEPEVRLVGAQIIYNESIEARTISPAAREYLRTMIGDSDVSVRLQVAQSLLNDKEALDPLLQQLAQESDPNVRAAIASALAPIRDLKAVPALVDQLRDPSMVAAKAAADALRQLGPLVREKDPKEAARIATQLRQIMDARTGPNQAGTEALREACVDAMVPMKDPEMLQTFIKLLDRRESVRVRRSALKGLGELGDPIAADQIVHNSLEDADASVRLEAVNALGKTSSVEHAPTLFKRLDPPVEPDAAVRQQAWTVLVSWLPKLSIDTLNQWADHELVRKDRQRQLSIRKAIAQKQSEAGDQEGLAITREQIGELLMEDNQPEEAAKFLRGALDFQRTRPQPVQVAVERLVERLTDALLKSRQYADAASFADEMIQENQIYQQTMGAKFRTEAERLHDANENKNALDLIEQTNKMKRPLGPRYRDELADLEKEVRRRLQEDQRNQSNAGPRTAEATGETNVQAKAR